MEKSKAARDRIVAELKRCAATSPRAKVNAGDIGARLALDEIEFGTAVSHLTALDKVGMIENDIYLREED